MPPSLLAVHASPREGGNSSALLDAVSGRFGRAGYDVTPLRPHRARIGHCLGCLSCEKTGRCVQRDDMDAFYPLLLEADVILFATPVYFYSVPGSAKIFIDRCQALWALRYRFPEDFARRSRPGRRGYLLGVGATRGKKLFSGLWLTLKYFFDAVGADIAGRLVYRELEEKDDFRKTAEHARRAEAWAAAVLDDLRPPPS